MTSSTSPTLSFVAHHIPPLLDGTYTLSLTHTLGYTEPQPGSSQPPSPTQQAFQKTHTFAVCGDRFSLSPDQIHKVFPPANTQGDYDTVLPHVVLRRRTLPWERKPAADTTHTRSWLAVLLFPHDQIPAATIGTLADLYPSTVTLDGRQGTLPADTYSYGSDASASTFLQHGQKPGDACVWLDLPLRLFAMNAPSLADLQWNAHARNRTHADGTTEDVAVVVGSRLPTPGQHVTAHLVSLEGLGDQLPQDDGSYATPPTWTAIRLVSLTSWHFKVGPLQESFSDVLTGLNGGIDAASGELADSQLRLPDGYLPAAAAAGSPTLPFDSGYSVLAGQASAASAWYRGPFLSSTVSPPPADATWSTGLLPANQASDLANAVSPAPGSDQSYAAAWQLGRLIALADREFATAQVAWKRDCRLALNVAIRQAGASLSGSRAAYAQAMRQVLADAATIQGHLGTGLTTDATATGSLYIPQTVVDWLGNLALLRNVPFTYLVPDDLMLPAESLRFFTVDPRWLAALLDGAWSLDREPSARWAFDTAYQPWAQLLAGTLTSSWATSTTVWPVSGFLMNSRLLPGYWPGIDVTTDTGALVLRQERLGPATLLTLYDQTYGTLTVQEPPEGIHWGFAMAETGDLTKGLRYVQIGSTFYPATTGAPANGQPVPSDVVPPLTAIPQRYQSVLQFDALAKQISTALGSPITAAEFALQLVQGVPSVTFTLPTSP